MHRLRDLGLGRAALHLIDCTASMKVDLRGASGGAAAPRVRPHSSWATSPLPSLGGSHDGPGLLARGFEAQGLQVSAPSLYLFV
jgi:hypothetical protein